VVSVLTFQAYNLWGGADLYNPASGRATVVTLARPYLDEAGLGLWDRGDGRILAWLQRRGFALQFTTDYDLALSPPSVAPRLLILGRHTEYVPGGLRDWVERHVDGTGDMNVLNFGANAFYWRARLQVPPGSSAAIDLACYRSLASDPGASANPADATVRWRDAPIDRPEGALLGAEYAGIIDAGTKRYDFQVAQGIPPALLAGTGWGPGTILRGLLRGEGDDLYPGVGATAVMTGVAFGRVGQLLHLSATIRTSPVGARIFDAGTFAWSDGLDPAIVNLGVPPGSFDWFTDHILAWLGMSPPRP
ncbi:MAG TPA: N,N-dimethylformamidase beta subunit family domain-containing protein, partial [Candidatus Binatus sp.]|nr:N,N-dimethylformamidase beta subunit family domain-containing protein [Candidatus Binatus sp.]